MDDVNSSSRTFRFAEQRLRLLNVRNANNLPVLDLIEINRGCVEITCVRVAQFRHSWQSEESEGIPEHTKVQIYTMADRVSSENERDKTDDGTVTAKNLIALENIGKNEKSISNIREKV